MYCLISTYENHGQLYETSVIAFGHKREIYSTIKRKITFNAKDNWIIGYSTSKSLRTIISELVDERHGELNSEMSLHMVGIPKKKYALLNGIIGGETVITMCDDFECASDEFNTIIRQDEENNSDSGLNNCVKLYEFNYEQHSIKLLDENFPEC